MNQSNFDYTFRNALFGILYSCYFLRFYNTVNTLNTFLKSARFLKTNVSSHLINTLFNEL